MDNWSLHLSKSSGRHYYFNSKTGERLWREDDLPDGWAFEWKEEKRAYCHVSRRQEYTFVKPAKQAAKPHAQAKSHGKAHPTNPKSTPPSASSSSSSLLGGLLGGRSEIASHGPTKRAQPKVQQQRRKPEDIYREQVLRRLTSFDADESLTKLEFEPIGGYAEEQKMYRYIVHCVVDEEFDDLISKAEGEGSDRHITVYKEGYAPEEDYGHEIVPAATVGQAKRRPKAATAPSVYGRDPGAANEVKTLNTKKRDRRSMEEIQKAINKKNKAQ
jgi:hypothetical protein